MLVIKDGENLLWIERPDTSLGLSRGHVALSERLIKSGPEETIEVPLTDVDIHALSIVREFVNTARVVRS